MEILNLTGHRLVLGTEHNHVQYPSHGRVRIDAQYEQVDIIALADGQVTVPLLLAANGKTHSLPRREEGRLIVVSGLVASRVRRADVVQPARLHRIDGRVQYASALMAFAR